MIMTGTLHYTQNNKKKAITRAMRLDSGTIKENCEKLGRWLKVRAIVESKKQTNSQHLILVNSIFYVRLTRKLK